MRSPLLLALLIASLASVVRAQDVLDTPSVAAAARSIRPNAIRGHMDFLTDPLLQGRAPDSPGYEISARYVASQLELLGLQPAGLNSTWYQSVPFRKSVLDLSRSSLLLLDAQGKEHPLVDGTDYILTANIVQETVSLEAPVTFVGFGVTAPEQTYDDYASIDVKGKIVAFFGGAPPKFPSAVRAYYADDFVKARNAIRHGAVAIITLTLPEDFKRQPWDWNVPQYRMGEIHWMEPAGQPHNPFSYGGIALLNEPAAQNFFNGSSTTYAQACANARASTPQAFPLVWTARIRSKSDWKTFNSVNVIAKLEGSDPALRDEYVVYTTHIDHLGFCPAVEGDNVCHGAVDNASGVATLLEIARAYTLLPQPPRRSVLFLFVTAEEAGLLGSDYFVHSPTVPLAKIVANVNIDEAPGLLYPMKNVAPLGAEHSSLQQNATRAASRMGYALVPDPMPEENNFIRSDQYSFVLGGVPALDLSDGPDSSDSAVHGLEVLKKWLVTRYHTPLDNMAQPLDFRSAANAASANFLLGYDIAQNPTPPSWNPDSYFGQHFGPNHYSAKPLD